MHYEHGDGYKQFTPYISVRDVDFLVLVAGEGERDVRVDVRV